MSFCKSCLRQLQILPDWSYSQYDIIADRYFKGILRESIHSLREQESIKQFGDVAKNLASPFNDSGEIPTIKMTYIFSWKI